MSETDSGPPDAASLTASVLAEEAARQAAQLERSREVLFADSLLPGVGGEPMGFKEGLVKGGLYTLVVVAIINSLDEIEGAAINVLGPDIADTFNVSNGTITFFSVVSVVFLAFGAGPLGWLADRAHRGRIIGVTNAALAAFAVFTALSVNAFMMFWGRFLSGVSRSSDLTVNPTLLADTYPIQIRGRTYALSAGLSRAAAALSPVLVGSIAALAGGVEGWRWVYIALAVAVAVMAVFALRLPEPHRGQWEQEEVLGAKLDDTGQIPISMEAAAARIWRIDTIRFMAIALAAIGFSLFPAQSIQSFFLNEHFGLTAWERGLATAPGGALLIIVLAIVGRRFDATFRTDPDKVLRIVGILLLPAAVLVPIQYSMPNVLLFATVGALNAAFVGAAFAMVQPSIQSVVPYRLRGTGTAVIAFFMLAVGGVGGGLAAAFLQNSLGERTAIIALTVISMPVGGFYMIKGSGRLRRDLSLMVAELQEEQEHQNDAAVGAIPAIQVRNVDFSYGQVQVLFNLSFEVEKGETLALLGTNGSGKSTILRVVTGLETPEHGVVRLNGHTITFATPEQRARLGIHMLPGGKGTFTGMSIRDNLVMGAYCYRSDKGEVERRIAKVLDLFPALGGRLDDNAEDLSGGQQQMLALARVMLHEPEVLIIDELSLGLAPTTVQSLLELIGSLRAAGQTMIIVEQSIDVALAVADRAVFLENGQVRFEGPARELAERNDLARAVFFGKEGG